MKAWLTQQLHQLKHSGPTAVLAELRQLVERVPQSTDLPEHLAYLEKREALMQYPRFQALGWPTGDGAVESGNKLAVEARLKGSEVHWARPHVNPMLALRNVPCNDRWEEAWSQIVLALRQQDQHRRSERRTTRHALQNPQPVPKSESSAVIPDPPVAPVAPFIQANERHPAADAPAKTRPTGPWRPPANRPWRRMRLGRARSRPHSRHPDPKT